MSELLDAILEDLKQVRGARGLKLVVSEEVFEQLKLEAEPHTQHVVAPNDPQLNCLLGMPFEISDEIEGWELHQEIPKDKSC
jgi:hypothetical protein